MWLCSFVVTVPCFFDFARQVMGCSCIEQPSKRCCCERREEEWKRGNGCTASCELRAASCKEGSGKGFGSCCHDRPKRVTLSEAFAPSAADSSGACLGESDPSQKPVSSSSSSSFSLNAVEVSVACLFAVSVQIFFFAATFSDFKVSRVE